MSALLDSTEQKLRAWEASDDPCDDAHNHFNAWEAEHGYRFWCDVADEGIRVHNLMFDDIVEAGSAEAAPIEAVAASAFQSGIAAVAAAIGLDADDLDWVVGEWGFRLGGADQRPPISVMELLAECEKRKAEREALAGGAA